MSAETTNNQEVPEEISDILLMLDNEKMKIQAINSINENGKLEITVAGVPKKIGARLLGDINNFKPGFVFKTSDSDDLEIRQNWKKLLTYRDNLNEVIEIEGHPVQLKTCIAMERTQYELSISDEYEELTGYHEKYQEIYEEDPEIWN